MKIFHASVACWLGLLLGASISSAADVVRINWVGGSGNYSDAANWEGGRIPRDTAEERFFALLPDAEISVTNDVTTDVFLLELGGANVRLQVDAPMTVAGVNLIGGIIGGAGPVALESLTVFEPFRNPGVSVLEGISLSPTSEVRIHGTLELRHDLAAGRWSRLVAQGITTFPEPDIFEVSVFASGSLIAIPVTGDDVTIWGPLRVSSPFLCAATVASHRKLWVNSSLILSNANFTHHGALVSFNGGEVLNHSTEPGRGQLHLISTSISGTGNVEVARIGAPPGQTARLNGQFGFGDVTLSNNVTVSLALRSSSAGESDHLVISNRLDNHARLELRMADGFHERVQNSDVIEILTCTPDTVVEGAFANVHFGGRFNAQDFGTFLIERVPGSESIQLRDWQPITFAIHQDFAPPLMHGFSGGLLQVAPSARLEVTGPVLWADGSVRATVTSGYVSGQDTWTIRSTGVGPGQILAQRSFVSPEQFIISFEGAPFATAEPFLLDRPVSASQEVICRLYSSASVPAIEALVRALQYRNETYNYELFENNIDAVYPNRQLSIAVLDHLGLAARLEREVYFPKVVKLVSTPSIIYVSSLSSANMIATAIFDTGDFTQRLGTQVTYTPSHPSLLSLTTLGGGVQRVSFAGSAPVEEECKITMQAGSFSGDCCVDLVGHAGVLVACILRALGVSESCEPDPFASPASLLSPVSSPNTAVLSLATFHALESLMQQSSEGRRLAGLYWRHTTEITDVAFAHPHLIKEARSLVLAWQPGVSELLAGRGTNAVITLPMINALTNIWGQFSSYASPELRAALDSERERLNNFQVFVGKNFHQWAGILQWPVPTQPWVRLTSPTRTPQSFRAEMNFVPGFAYSLWRSLNFSDWVPIPDLRLQTNGLTISLTDTNTAHSNGFYRAVLQP